MDHVLFAFLGALFTLVVTLIVQRVSQARLFDHRLRLEKEYQIYCDLWDSLFEFRRSAGNLADASDEGKALADFEATLNRYQSVVRRNEPFVHQSIYEPARELVTLGRRMHLESPKIGRRKKCQQKAATADSDEQAEKRQFDAEDRRAAIPGDIDALYEVVRDRIRDRVSLRR